MEILKGPVYIKPDDALSGVGGLYTALGKIQTARSLAIRNTDLLLFPKIISLKTEINNTFEALDKVFKKHMLIVDNPHKANKSSVGLSKVNEFGVASNESLAHGEEVYDEYIITDNLPKLVNSTKPEIIENLLINGFGGEDGWKQVDRFPNNLTRGTKVKNTGSVKPYGYGFTTITLDGKLYLVAGKRKFEYGKDQASVIESQLYTGITGNDGEDLENGDVRGIGNSIYDIVQYSSEKNYDNQFTFNDPHSFICYKNNFSERLYYIDNKYNIGNNKPMTLKELKERAKLNDEDVIKDGIMNFKRPSEFYIARLECKKGVRGFLPVIDFHVYDPDEPREYINDHYLYGKSVKYKNVVSMFGETITELKDLSYLFIDNSLIKTESNKAILNKYMMSSYTNYLSLEWIDDENGVLYINFSRMNIENKTRSHICQFIAELHFDIKIDREQRTVFLTLNDKYKKIKPKEEFDFRGDYILDEGIGYYQNHFEKLENEDGYRNDVFLTDGSEYLDNWTFIKGKGVLKNAWEKGVLHDDNFNNGVDIGSYILEISECDSLIKYCEKLPDHYKVTDYRTYTKIGGDVYAKTESKDITFNDGIKVRIKSDENQDLFISSCSQTPGDEYLRLDYKLKGYKNGDFLTVLNTFNKKSRLYLHQNVWGEFNSFRNGGFLYLTKDGLLIRDEIVVPEINITNVRKFLSKEHGTLGKDYDFIITTQTGSSYGKNHKDYLKYHCVLTVFKLSKDPDDNSEYYRVLNYVDFNSVKTDNTVGSKVVLNDGFDSPIYSDWSKWKLTTDDNHYNDRYRPASHLDEPYLEIKDVGFVSTLSECDLSTTPKLDDTVTNRSYFNYLQVFTNTGEFDLHPDNPIQFTTNHSDIKVDESQKGVISFRNYLDGFDTTNKNHTTVYPSLSTLFLNNGELLTHESTPNYYSVNNSGSSYTYFYLYKVGRGFTFYSSSKKLSTADELKMNLKYFGYY